MWKSTKLVQKYDLKIRSDTTPTKLGCPFLYTGMLCFSRSNRAYRGRIPRVCWSACGNRPFWNRWFWNYSRCWFRCSSYSFGNVLERLERGWLPSSSIVGRFSRKYLEHGYRRSNGSQSLCLEGLVERLMVGIGRLKIK